MIKSICIIEMYRANYPVDNPYDYWKISLYTLSSWII